VDRTNPGLVDLLVNQVRKDLALEKTAPEKKPSILEKLQKTPTSEASVLKPGKPVRREALR
jgi:hypothetical protein